MLPTRSEDIPSKYLLETSQSLGSCTGYAKFDDVGVASIVHKPRSNTPWHSHGDSRFIVTTGGTGLQVGKNRSIHRRAGIIQFNPAGDPHRDVISPNGLNSLTLELGFSFQETLRESGYQLNVRFDAESFEACTIAQRIDDLLFDKELLSSQFRLRGLAYELLAIFISQCVGPTFFKPSNWLSAAHDFILSEYRRRPSFEQIAKAVGVNPAHLERSFRKHYGISMVALVRKLVTEEALRLLQHSNKSNCRNRRNLPLYPPTFLVAYAENVWLLSIRAPLQISRLGRKIFHHPIDPDAENLSPPNRIGWVVTVCRDYGELHRFPQIA